MAGPAEEKDEARWLVVRGRRWRRQDPELPAEVATALRSHLGRARNAVRQAKSAGDEAATAAARKRVGAAKRGLGERGTPWWEQSITQRRERWSAALTELAELDPER